MNDKLELALKIATKAHEGQVDKAGQPYINHPMHVASLVTKTNEKIVALLHDVVEDTNITFKYLEAQGFSDEIIEALKLLTHDESVTYFDYVELIKCNKLARAVKVADLTHNSDISRIINPQEKDRKRIEKYKQALLILKN